MNLLNLEDEKFKNVKVQGYHFKIRYISPLDRIKISQRRTDLQGRRNVEEFTDSEFMFFENIGMVDICVEDLPKDFDQNESCANWPSSSIINEIAGEIRKFTDDFESKLKKNRPVDGGK